MKIGGDNSDDSTNENGENDNSENTDGTEEVVDGMKFVLTYNYYIEIFVI